MQSNKMEFTMLLSNGPLRLFKCKGVEPLASLGREKSMTSTLMSEVDNGEVVKNQSTTNKKRVVQADRRSQRPPSDDARVLEMGREKRRKSTSHNKRVLALARKKCHSSLRGRKRRCDEKHNLADKHGHTEDHSAPATQ